MPEAPVRRTARSVDCRLSDVRVFRIIDKHGRGCKDEGSARNAMKSIVLHFRFDPFLLLQEEGERREESAQHCRSRHIAT
jgi:hypothetical protein